MGFGLATTVIVARILGPEGRGLYAIAVATGWFGVQFGNLGMYTANVYLVAGNPCLLDRLAGNSIALSFGFGGLLAVLVSLVFLLFPNLISLRGATLFWALSWIPFGLAYLLMQGLMLGMHDVRGYNLFEMISKIVPLVLIAGLVLFGWDSVASFFAAGVVALVVSCTWMWKRLAGMCTIKPSVSFALFRESIRYAIRAYLTAVFAFFVLRADLFMVEHIRGAEQAGYYSIAAAMADYVSVLAAIVGTILFPKLSAMKEIGPKLRLTYKAIWATVGLLVPILAAASFVAKPLVRLLFGTAFLPTSEAFVLLMPGMLFLGMNAVAVQFLNSIGYPKSVVVIWGLCAVFNVGLNLWVIPRYGIAGASVVSSVSYFLVFFFIFRLVRAIALESSATEVSAVNV
jgi:O-antigen/teichoic acid export membrane protein